MGINHGRNRRWDSVVAKEGEIMLGAPSPAVFSDVDRQVFEALVPADHFLRRVDQAVDFPAFRPLLESGYSPDHGRPADEPVRLLKLCYLQFQFHLSDREVIARTGSDVAFRWFLGLGLTDAPPDASTLCVFRGRLGVDHFQAVFNALIAQARERGLVRDRLRLKDASHVLTSVAIPNTLSLVAQTRNKLLEALRPFDATRVAGEEARLVALRVADEGLAPEQRLEARVAHLVDILAWADDVTRPPELPAEDRRWHALHAARQLAHKILADHDAPQAGNRTRSAVDPDVRRGKHGVFYDGYQLDILMDADSELLTQINVLPANGDEARDGAELVRREEAAQHNDIAALSMDKAGFQGEVLRELEDPQGLALDAYVPPKTEPATDKFVPQDFSEDADRSHVTCPAGQTSHYRQRELHGIVYRFAQPTCAACPLRRRCVSGTLQGLFGRTIRKSDYEEEHRRARAKAQTPEYSVVRREHPKVERKLSEILVRHDGRHARYWGQPKVYCQELLTTFAVNVKRIVHLVCAPRPALVTD